jgi:hypothetical protein
LSVRFCCVEVCAALNMPYYPSAVEKVVAIEPSPGG